VEARGAVANLADTVAEGTVGVVGPVETAEVVLRGATASVGLTGPLVGELRRLSGATIRVRGTPRSNPAAAPARAIDVGEYEVLDVEGQRPVVGVLLRRDDRLWLAGQDTVELVGVTPELVARSGAKVFVLGVPEGRRLRVKSYGVIQDPR
jgi:hypothetical protein